eukprot:1718623-Rhodomonas_salina.1
MKLRTAAAVSGGYMLVRKTVTVSVNSPEGPDLYLVQHESDVMVNRVRPVREGSFASKSLVPIVAFFAIAGRASSFISASWLIVATLLIVSEGLAWLLTGHSAMVFAVWALKLCAWIFFGTWAVAWCFAWGFVSLASRSESGNEKTEFSWLELMIAETPALIIILPAIYFATWDPLGLDWFAILAQYGRMTEWATLLCGAGAFFAYFLVRSRSRASAGASTGASTGASSDAASELAAALAALEAAGGAEEESDSDSDDGEGSGEGTKAGPEQYLDELLAVGDARAKLGQLDLAGDAYYRAYYAAIAKYESASAPQVFPIGHKMIQVCC